MKDAKGHGSDARNAAGDMSRTNKLADAQQKSNTPSPFVNSKSAMYAPTPAAHQTGVEHVQRAFDAGHHFESYMQHTGKDKLFRVDEVGHLHPPGAGSVAALRGLRKAGKVSTESVPGVRFGYRYKRVP